MKKKIIFTYHKIFWQNITFKPQKNHGKIFFDSWKSIIVKIYPSKATKKNDKRLLLSIENS